MPLGAQRIIGQGASPESMVQSSAVNVMFGGFNTVTCSKLRVRKRCKRSLTLLVTLKYSLLVRYIGGFVSRGISESAGIIVRVRLGSSKNLFKVA